VTTTRVVYSMYFLSREREREEESLSRTRVCDENRCVSFSAKNEKFGIREKDTNADVVFCVFCLRLLDENVFC